MFVSNSPEGSHSCNVFRLNHEIESPHFARGSFHLYLFTILSQCLICQIDNHFLPDKGAVAFLVFVNFLRGVYF